MDTAEIMMSSARKQILLGDAKREEPPEDFTTQVNGTLGQIDSATEYKSYQKEMDYTPLPAWPAPQEQLLNQAKQEYPILKDHDIGFKYSPNRSQGFLEFWPAGEPGDASFQRPKELDPKKPGIEVYNPKTRPIDILGDVVSHHLVDVDPTIKKHYEDFGASLEPWQHKNLQRQYEHAKKNDGESRSFEDWKKSSGLPAYFRGYPFQQWDHAEEMYTPGQMKNLDQMMRYLRSPRQR